jgi:hypothetical protein
MFGISTYWHKRIVRAGLNTLAPYDENPPDLLVGEDDILFLDLGPVFEESEADFGRTFVIGSDPAKLKLRDDIAKAFADGKKYFQEHSDVTGVELFKYAEKLAEQYGWEFGGAIAGHLIGQFPHERNPGDKVTLYVIGFWRFTSWTERGKLADFMRNCRLSDELWNRSRLELSSTAFLATLSLHMNSLAFLEKFLTLKLIGWPPGKQGPDREFECYQSHGKQDHSRGR